MNSIQIDEGGFGKVFEVRCTDNGRTSSVAAKFVKLRAGKSEEDRALEIINEVLLFKRLKFNDQFIYKCRYIS